MSEHHSDVPRKGNVDRNALLALFAGKAGATFPARGTWIEMLCRKSLTSSVRRTFPARGTWIEISASQNK